jgi:hypothetical protein
LRDLENSPRDQAALSALQGYLDLVLITEGAEDNIRAPCSWNLLAKDGVYLMNVPREVDDLVLAAGNRCIFITSNSQTRTPTRRTGCIETWMDVCCSSNGMVLLHPSQVDELVLTAGNRYAAAMRWETASFLRSYNISYCKANGMHCRSAHP